MLSVHKATDELKGEWTHVKSRDDRLYNAHFNFCIGEDNNSGHCTWARRYFPRRSSRTGNSTFCPVPACAITYYNIRQASLQTH